MCQVSMKCKEQHQHKSLLNHNTKYQMNEQILTNHSKKKRKKKYFDRKIAQEKCE